MLLFFLISAEHGRTVVVLRLPLLSFLPSWSQWEAAAFQMEESSGTAMFVWVALDVFLVDFAVGNNETAMAKATELSASINYHGNHQDYRSLSSRSSIRRRFNWRKVKCTIARFWRSLEFRFSNLFLCPTF